MYVIIGSINGLVADVSKPLIEPMMTKNCDVQHQAIQTYAGVLIGPIRTNFSEI